MTARTIWPVLWRELLRWVSRNPPFYTGSENGQVCERCGKTEGRV